MKQPLKVRIPEPCQENLNLMAKTENGRFCTTCSKEVIDFTKMSDAEVLAYFDRKKIQNDRVCGTFRVDQVSESKLISIPRDSYFQIQNHSQKFLWMLLVCMGFWFVSCNTTQKGKVAIEVVDTIKSTQETIDGEVEPIQLTGDTVIVDQPKDNIKGQKQNCLTGYTVEMPQNEINGGAWVGVPEELPTMEYVKGKIKMENIDTSKTKVGIPTNDSAIHLKRPQIIGKPNLNKNRLYPD